MVTMEMEPQPAKKAVKRKKASKVKRFMFWKGVGYSGKFFYIPHHPSLSNVQRKADLKEKELEQQQRELEFQRQKYEEEATERKARLQLELEECRAFMSFY